MTPIKLIDQKRCRLGVTCINFVWCAIEPVLSDKNILGLCMFSSGVLGYEFLRWPWLTATALPSPIVNISQNKKWQETPQCDENQVFNDSTKYLCDRKKKWKTAMMKNDVVILVALVACTKFSVNRPKQTKVIEQKLNFYI